MPGGRPTNYDPARNDEVRAACERGATNQDVADLLGVNVATIKRWRHSHPEFCAALKAGKEHADDAVEASLYQRALGYSHRAEKVVNTPDGPTVVTMTEVFPPDTTAAIFWLKNRRRADWRDRQDVDLNLDDAAAERIARALTKAREGA